MADKSLPKAKKLPDMKDFQLFDHKRIAELYESEHQREVKRARAVQRAAEAGGQTPTSPPTHWARLVAIDTWLLDGRLVHTSRMRTYDIK